MTFLEVFLGAFSREKSPANNMEFILSSVSSGLCEAEGSLASCF